MPYKHHTPLLCLTLAMVFFLSFNYAYAKKNSNEASAIRAVINKQFDTPNSKVVINPIVIKGDHAVASWLHAELGGRAVLEKGEDNHWKIALCAGKQVNDVHFLAATGIPSSVAKDLIENLQRAEAALTPQNIKRFDSFNAIIRGSHTPLHRLEHEVNGSPHNLHREDTTLTHKEKTNHEQLPPPIKAHH